MKIENVKSVSECEKACSEDDECKSFTYNAQSDMQFCNLKKSCNHTVKGMEWTETYTSAVKTGAYIS